MTANSTSRTEQFLTAQEAAKLLRLNVKRIQAMARTGRLNASRVGRKWLFPRAPLLAKLGHREPAPERPLQARPLRERPLDISARNSLWGPIVGLTLGDVMAEVRVQIGDQELVAIITRSSAERLGLAVGDTVAAVIKSTEVMIGKG
jgi:molybdopterin-binding protein